MRKVICFGDSNTFGFNPQDGSRYDSNTRWTGVLANMLGEAFEVVEEGCNNRTGFFQNPDGHLQSGQRYLPECLKKYKDFSVIILALGTNDLQSLFKLDEKIADEGLKNLINIVRKSNKQARIIVIPPVKLEPNILQGYFSHQFDDESINASCWIQGLYEKIVEDLNCELLDLNKYVRTSDFDGLHFDENSHKIIAEKLASVVLNTFVERKEYEHCKN